MIAIFNSAIVYARIYDLTLLGAIDQVVFIDVFGDGLLAS